MWLVNVVQDAFGFMFKNPAEEWRPDICAFLLREMFAMSDALREVGDKVDEHQSESRPNPPPRERARADAFAMARMCRCRMTVI